MLSAYRLLACVAPCHRLWVVVLMHFHLHLLYLVSCHVADLAFIVTVEVMVVWTNLVAMTMVALYDDNLGAW